nr:LysR family transcriptional regulator [Sphingomonas sp. Y57]
MSPKMISLNLFDLNLIKCLSALLAERNVTRAAERLNTTQQAMSHNLRRLRDHFQDELLIRVGRRFELTPLAVALEIPIRELMLQISTTLETRPIFNPEVDTHRFRIAMTDYGHLTILPKITQILAERAPNLSCDFYSIDPHVFGDLERGDLEFCVMPRNPHPWLKTIEPWFRSQHLFSDEFVCVVDKNHPDIGDTIDLDQYCQAKHAVVQFNSRGMTIIQDAWIKHQLDIQVAIRAASFASLVFMLPGTRLVATVQRRIANALKSLIDVKVLQSPIPIEQLHETLNWHGRNDSNPAHSFMRSVFAEAAAVLNGGR